MSAVQHAHRTTVGGLADRFAHTAGPFSLALDFMNESVIWKPMAGGYVAGECSVYARIEDIKLLMIDRQKILSQGVSGLCALGSGLSALI